MTHLRQFDVSMPPAVYAARLNESVLISSIVTRDYWEAT